MEEKTLTNTEGEVNTTVKALFFGELVKLASPHLEHYHSDLWHDAMAVGEINGPASFFYSVNNTGTALLRFREDEPASVIKDWMKTREHSWKISLIKQERSYGAKWLCRIEEYKPSE